MTPPAATTAPPTGGPDPADATITAALLRLQHQLGWLSDQALRDLAVRLGVPIYKLEEVVSFFPHFRRKRPPYLELNVCRDMSCHLNGAQNIRQTLEERFAGDGRVEVQGVSCLGRCDRAPAVCVNRYSEANGQAGHDIHDAVFLKRAPMELATIAAKLAAGGPLPAPDTDADGPKHCDNWTIDVYNGAPKYEAVRAALRQLRQAEDRTAARAQLDIIPKLELSGLRGMGGAGAPAGKKWKDVRNAAGTEKYVVCNGDESEPATFKDRELLLRTPWLTIEGVILAGLATGATRGYIYVRHEYPEQIAALRAEIANAEKMGACGRNLGNIGIHFPVSVFVSPGGYICGEQSALIEAMEGHRAQPRNRPPELATNGLFDKPTLVNNVETFAWAAGIARNTVLGPEGKVNWYGSLAPDGKSGARFLSISGDVNRPGAYEVTIGAPLRDLFEAAGGVIGGEANLLGIAPSGPSGGYLPKAGLKWPATYPGRTPHPKAGQPLELLDAPMDIDFFRLLKSSFGAGLVAYARGVDMTAQAVNATEFYRNESCGKCVPCRVGSQKLVELGRLVKTTPDASRIRDTVRELDRAMEQTSICGLGQVAAKPLISMLRYFPPSNVVPTDWSMRSMSAMPALPAGGAMPALPTDKAREAK